MSIKDTADSQDAQASLPLDDKLRKILKSASISGKYGDTHEATYLELLAQIHQAFAEDGYYYGGNIEQSDRHGMKLMTGEEWYKRFEAEYHMRADWINSDPVMGADAESDVLSAARLASGLDT